MSPQPKREGPYGPPVSTITVFVQIIRFNNNNHLTHGPPRFLPTRGSSRRGVLPPLRGGNSCTKESPALPIPSYPAQCREDTTSWNDGQPRTHHTQCNFKMCVKPLANNDSFLKTMQVHYLDEVCQA